MSYWCVIVLVSALVALLGTGTDYKIGATSDKITSADPYSNYN